MALRPIHELAGGLAGLFHKRRRGVTVHCTLANPPANGMAGELVTIFTVEMGEDQRVALTRAIHVRDGRPIPGLIPDQGLTARCIVENHQSATIEDTAVIALVEVFERAGAADERRWSRVTQNAAHFRIGTLRPDGTDVFYLDNRSGYLVSIQFQQAQGRIATEGDLRRGDAVDLAMTTAGDVHPLRLNPRNIRRQD